MKKIFQECVALIRNRFVIFAVFLGVFITTYHIYFGAWLPSTDTKDIWFYSGLFMVLFSILFIEPYYTSPKNVLTNVIPLLLVFLAIKTSFNNPIFWWAAIILFLGLLISSIISLALEDNTKSPDHWKNKVATSIKNVVIIIGQGKVLYSAVFIYFLLTYYSIQNLQTLLLFIIWFFILSINPKNIHGSFAVFSRMKDHEQLGEIFGVQSKRIFLAKLYEDRNNVRKFDVVKFRYSMQDIKNSVITGIVFDTYLLNQEKWAKLLQLSEPQEEMTKFEKNIVYKISDADAKKLEGDLKLNELAGVVVEGSTIGKIKFEYSKNNDDLQEGDLLELKISNKRLFYQVISGTTEKENLGGRNEMGFIEGEAIQLGEWCSDELSFQKFGWVPPINTPVFKSTASDITVESYSYPNYQLGTIPGTSLPSVLNLNEAVSHHMALLGVTGSGKSFLAREIINQIKIDTKIICVDFNKEFVTKLTPPPSNIITDASATNIAEKIDWINNELGKFANQQDRTGIATAQNEIKRLLRIDIEAFIDGTDSNVRVFELPEVSNTTGILDYTKYFFKVLFEIAKARSSGANPTKICVVLEEAHTVIPEWNFSGSSDKTSQGLVNSIGQIALQGRKYGVGFLVIAQRTANVSKTVLTQCNTVVCFKAYDETSFNFLSNYVGKDMVQALPNLKQYHAVVAGKAVKSNMPMIVDLER